MRRKDARPALAAGALSAVLSFTGCTEVEPHKVTESSSGPGGTGSTGEPTPTTGAGEPGDPEPTTGVDPTVGMDCAELRDQSREILTNQCAACHTGPGAAKFDDVDDLDALIESGKVEPGDPEASLLYQTVEGGLMPKGGPPLSALEMSTLYSWIDECTGPSVMDPGGSPACVGTNQFIPIDEMLDWMLVGINDFGQIDPTDQPFIRYFTLTHLWNAGFCDEQLEAHRHALAKLINSLSNEGDITIPTAIDPNRTIFRIDLRDYGWDKELWELLVSENEFGVQYTQSKAVQLQTLSGTLVPFQWADWFVTDASEPPLYDRVLYERVLKVKPDVLAPAAPLTRFELEAFLGIPVQANIDDALINNNNNVSRAGFQFSGVSDQNRVIERHAFNGSDGAYWLSYDFADGSGTGNVFNHPLDFVPAGGEIIFNLPNGLQAYLLVDDLGRRIDEASTDIVKNKEEGGDVIRNGRSCMGCHYQGMRSAEDEVRNYVENIGIFDAITIEKVQHIYPNNAEFSDLLLKDKDYFIGHLVETGAPLLVKGKEVISAAFHAFEDPPIDDRRAAAEFGITAEELEPKIGKLPQGLGMLNGGVVSRQVMRSFYAEAICTLQLGITKACKPL